MTKYTDCREFPSMMQTRTTTVECEGCGEEFETLAESREGESVERPLSYCSIRCEEKDKGMNTETGGNQES